MPTLTLKRQPDVPLEAESLSPDNLVGKTPDEVARLAQIDHEELSRLEQRDDTKLSTIRRYVRALGGDLELVVVLKTGHRMRLDI